MGNLLMGICADGTCCCLPPRSTIVLISLLSMVCLLIFFLYIVRILWPSQQVYLTTSSTVACFTDMMSSEACTNIACPMRDYVESSRLVLLTLYQFANALLLLAAILENAFLVQLYVWYVLAFVVLGFGVTILDLLCRFNDGRRTIHWSVFVPEVAFLFVLYRCTPIVDAYRKLLEGQIKIKS